MLNVQNLAIIFIFLLSGCANIFTPKNSLISVIANNKAIDFYQLGDAKSSSYILVPKEKRTYAQGEITAIAAQMKLNQCLLPSADDITFLATKEIVPQDENLRQLYWIADSDPNSQGYALYFHIPTRQIMEFGDLVFPAHILFICNANNV